MASFWQARPEPVAHGTAAALRQRERCDFPMRMPGRMGAALWQATGRRRQQQVRVLAGMGMLQVGRWLPRTQAAAEVCFCNTCLHLHPPPTAFLLFICLEAAYTVQGLLAGNTSGCICGPRAEPICNGMQS